MKDQLNEINEINEIDEMNEINDFVEPWQQADEINEDEEWEHGVLVYDADDRGDCPDWFETIEEAVEFIADLRKQGRNEEWFIIEAEEEDDPRLWPIAE